MLVNVDPSELKFGADGLIPAIVQDGRTKQVLTLAYMNRESLEKTLETGETWFFSRSRQALWHKGATSGHTQKVIAVSRDCDQDALLIQVEPRGPACHTGSVSCFGGEADKPEPESILAQLETVIAERQQERPEGSYTTYLFDKGIDKILKKVGEEAAEVIIAAKNEGQAELRYEAADLLYHLLVLLREKDLPFGNVLAELRERHGK
ncbi:bifunctional phosphoribosyl-AMP cyclohydrolase/phosphoribosyl-ATP diphosphatase HisIE [Laceyella sacchari]|uniref:Histidine biosynthesis bifunctional protein HisIE n=1 Tax=Laceyella sacchari TaxID=37482 RepID=A0ABY5U580_LACSH|nr:bifunctional phosphoribosyl-AMP cyclohydrolase/phosphoribosyl-ATP diphosphatase HisIE [Laceyella sacchari]UWE03437.1 bifunctional phosphoribosyl-AMP cyclohydrolase/phosphoribosyl-ATP diphosphatase HisIE [Laceyella sacchari]